MAFRAFVAVDVGPLDGLVRLHRELQGADAALKVVDPANFHLTLKFLGDIDDAQAAEVASAMEAACDGVAPFTLRFHGVGAFPDHDFIKVVWAGVEDADALGPVADRLHDDLAHIRDEKRAFSPHLTLARMRGAKGKEWVQDFLERHADDAIDTLEVDAVRLKRSDLSPEGPTYTTVEEVPLAG